MATDIIYIKTPWSMMYFTAVIDLYSRKILSWTLSDSMKTDFCIECVREAFEKYGVPSIFNTDCGSQYTSGEFIEQLKYYNVEISMDGIGRCKDNIAECCCNEYKTYFTDCTALIDELLILKNSNGIKYKQSLNKFGKFQVLILDDFLITHLNEERNSILFQLIKIRENNGTSTIVTCQYPATDWGDFMGSQNEPALSDAIRRRLTSGFILNIE